MSCQPTPCVQGPRKRRRTSGSAAASSQFVLRATTPRAKALQEQAKAKEMLDNAVKQMFKELGREEYLRLEDFAQTLVHTDFAHKYTLHINTKSNPKKTQALIDKTKKDLEAEEERLKKEEESPPTSLQENSAG